MTLDKLIKKQTRESDRFNSDTVSKVLNRSNLKLETLKVNSEYTDEIRYILGRINRC